LSFLDPELRATRTNAALRQMAGLPDEAIIGRRPSEVDDGMDVALVERTLAEQVLKKGVPVADVPVVQTLAGKRRVVLLSADPVDRSLEFSHVLAAIRLAALAKGSSSGSRSSFRAARLVQLGEDLSDLGGTRVLVAVIGYSLPERDHTAVHVDWLINVHDADRGSPSPPTCSTAPRPTF